MRIKICGITQLEQGRAIAELGATALGFICVAASPRHIRAEDIGAMAPHLPETVARIGVFANATFEEICDTVATGKLTGVQLHGGESVELCDRLRDALPRCELIRAVRVKTPPALDAAAAFVPHVDALLLDAYHPQQLGGTGRTLDWRSLREFRPKCPWFLAGGLTPDNITDALTLLQPDGIDLSSGVERSPGDKDIEKVAKLFRVLRKNPAPPAGDRI